MSVIRPGRGDITTTRFERYTASGIECVTNTTDVPVSAQMRSSSACMCSRVISSSAPNGSSINSSGGWAASARAIATPLLHATRQLPRPVIGELAELHQVEHLARPVGPARLVPPLELERQLDVLGDAAPVEQAGLLERHAVLLVDARLVRALAVDRDRPGRRRDQIGDQSEQRRLAATRRSDQRHELAGLHGEVDVDERVDLVRPAAVEDLARRPARRRHSCQRLPDAFLRTVAHQHEVEERDEPGHHEAERRPRRRPR